jgi:serine/threonine protein kinase
LPAAKPKTIAAPMNTCCCDSSAGSLRGCTTLGCFAGRPNGWTSLCLDLLFLQTQRHLLLRLVQAHNTPSSSLPSFSRSTTTVSKQTDIFANGCAIYEIMTGRPPYHELETYDDRARWPPPYSRARRQTPEGRNFGDTIGLSHHISRQKISAPKL